MGQEWGYLGFGGAISHLSLLLNPRYSSIGAVSLMDIPEGPSSPNLATRSQTLSALICLRTVWIPDLFNAADVMAT